MSHETIHTEYRQSLTFVLAVILSLLAFTKRRSPTLFYSNYTGWPKKVSHYRDLSLNRIKKNRQPG